MDHDKQITKDFVVENFIIRNKINGLGHVHDGHEALDKQTLGRTNPDSPGLAQCNHSAMNINRLAIKWNKTQ